MQHKAKSQFRPVTNGENVTGENQQKPNVYNDCDTVTGRKGGTERKGHSIPKYAINLLTIMLLYIRGVRPTDNTGKEKEAISTIRWFIGPLWIITGPFLIINGICHFFPELGPCSAHSIVASHTLGHSLHHTHDL